MDGQASFDAYVRARGPALFRIAYLLTGKHHLAQDLAQQALLSVVGRWRRLAAAGDPDAYVRRALYTEHVSGWRWRRRRVTEIPVDQLVLAPGGGRSTLIDLPDAVTHVE